jgi:Predicted NADH:ubiquinone oxidoreductase, subunit RnfE
MMDHMQIWRDGLWTRNPGLIQLLGLCPLLAVSNTLDNAVGLAMATVAVLVLSNASISLIRTTVADTFAYPSLY